MGGARRPVSPLAEWYTPGMEDAHMEALLYAEEPLEPDVSHLVTEDDAPVDSWISEKQMRLFPNILHASWNPGRPFVAAAGVGLFDSVDEPAVVPDIMVSLDVTLPEDCRPKGRVPTSPGFSARPRNW